MANRPYDRTWDQMKRQKQKQNRQQQQPPPPPNYLMTNAHPPYYYPPPPYGPQIYYGLPGYYPQGPPNQPQPPVWKAAVIPNRARGEAEGEEDIWSTPSSNSQQQPSDGFSSSAQLPNNYYVPVYHPSPTPTPPPQHKKKIPRKCELACGEKFCPGYCGCPFRKCIHMCGGLCRAFGQFFTSWVSIIALFLILFALVILAYNEWQTPGSMAGAMRTSWWQSWLAMSLGIVTVCIIGGMVLRSCCSGIGCCCGCLGNIARACGCGPCLDQCKDAWNEVDYKEE